MEKNITRVDMPFEKSVATVVIIDRLYLSLDLPCSVEVSNALRVRRPFIFFTLLKVFGILINLTADLKYVASRYISTDKHISWVVAVIHEPF
jgi:hypothetical protein